MPKTQARFLKVVDKLRSSYWFLPAVLVLVAAGLAFGCMGIDQRFSFDSPLHSPLYMGEPTGARAVLTTIAGSMISIVSLAFSATVVALALTSSQFGSRLLYNFMRDRGNQFTLGFYVGTFVYCLIVLSAVRVDGDDFMVPHVSIMVALMLALMGVAILVYFFHHIAESIQAGHVVRSVGCELLSVVDRVLPRDNGNSEPRKDLERIPAFGDEPHASVDASKTGVVQAIDVERMLMLATERNLCVRYLVRPGDFVVEGNPVLRVTPRPHDVDLLDDLRYTVIQGCRRTLVQDLEFGLCQLVEIAVRALSPGTNDPFTAMSCLDQIGAALSSMVERDEIPRAHADEDGIVRVLTNPTTIAEMIDTAFDQIRRHGASDLAVCTRMLRTIETVSVRARREDQREALRRQADLILEAAESGTLLQTDLERLRHDHSRALFSLDGSNSPEARLAC